MAGTSSSSSSSSSSSNPSQNMDKFNDLVKDVKSKLIHDGTVKYMLPKEPTWDEMEGYGNERASYLGGFTRSPSDGDGNCFFRSCSKAVATHENLHPPIRQGTVSLMRLNRDLYNTKNMSPNDYSDYLDVMDTDLMPVGRDVSQAASDLLGARVVRTYATTGLAIDEVTPRDGPILHDINLANIPGHVDNLFRDKLYPYHLKDSR